MIISIGFMRQGAHFIQTWLIQLLVSQQTWEFLDCIDYIVDYDPSPLGKSNSVVLTRTNLIVNLNCSVQTFESHWVEYQIIVPNTNTLIIDRKVHVGIHLVFKANMKMNLSCMDQPHSRFIISRTTEIHHEDIAKVLIDAQKNPPQVVTKWILQYRCNLT